MKITPIAKYNSAKLYFCKIHIPVQNGMRILMKMSGR